MMLLMLVLLVATAHCQQDSDEDVSCTLDDGSIGECVWRILCDVQLFEDLIDTRFAEQGPCKSAEDRCCPLSAVRSPPKSTTPQATTKKSAPTPQSSPTLLSAPMVVRQGCGWRNPEGVDLSATSESDGETKFGEFPWTVAVMEVKPINTNEPEGAKHEEYKGAGSLIGLSMVLTVAHTIVTAKSLKIRAGEWNTQSKTEIYPFQDRNVATAEIHKDFNKKNLFFDVAILFLQTPVALAPNIGVACLPTAPETVVGGTRCYVTGWGRFSRGSIPQNQTILQKVVLPIVEHNNCQERLRQTRLGNNFKLHASFICAGGEKGPEICVGDAGSPLSCPLEVGSERYVVSGAATWRIGCGAEGNPGTYADLAYLRQWIDEKVTAHGYDTKSYTV